MVFSFISTRLYLCTLSSICSSLSCVPGFPPPPPPPLFFQDPHFIRHSLLCSTPPCFLSLFLSSQSAPALSPLFGPRSLPSLRLPCLFNLFITVFSVYAFPVSSICSSPSSLSTPSLSLQSVHHRLLCLRLPLSLPFAYHCLRSVYAFPVSSICSSLSSLCLRLPCLFYLFITVCALSTPSLSQFIHHCLHCLRLPRLFYLLITVFSVYAFPVSAICSSLSLLCLHLPCTVSSIYSSLSSLCLYVPCLFYLFFTVFSVYAFLVISLFIAVFSLSMPSLSPLFVPHCLLFLPPPQPSLRFVL